MAKDLTNLENEIVRECGEDLLKDLRMSRKGSCFASGCMTIVFTFAFIIFVLLPAASLVLNLSFYHRADLEATAVVTELEFDDFATIYYEFTLGEEAIQGKSKLLQRDASAMKAGDELPILYSQENPKVNRAQAEIHPVRDAAMIITGWVCVGILLLPAFLSFLFLRGKKTPDDLDWLEYITTVENPSPRSWMQHTIKNGLTTSSIPFSTINMDPRYVLSDEDLILNEEELLALTAKEEPEGDIMISLMKRLKYIRRWNQKYQEPVTVPTLEEPTHLDLCEGEDLPMSLFAILGTLANNGAAEQPEYDAVEIDFSHSDLRDIRRKVIEARSVEKEVRTKIHLDNASEERAIEKAQEEAGFTFKASDIPVRFYHDGKEIDPPLNNDDSLHADHALLLLRGILYLFYATPWQAEVLERELPYSRIDKKQVLISLRYEPETKLRLSRRYDASLNADIPDATNENELPPGIHTLQAMGTSYTYFWSTEPKYLRVEVPLKSFVKEIPEDSEVLNEFYVNFTQRNLKGIWLLLSSVFKIAFWPTTVPPATLHFFKKCGISTNLKFRRLVAIIAKDPNRRSAIEQLHQRGYSTVNLNGESWILHCLDKEYGKQEFEKDMIRNLQILKIASQDLGKLIHEEAPRVKRAEKLRLIANFIIAIIIICGAAFGLIATNRQPYLHEDDMIYYVFPFAIVLSLILNYYTFWATRFIEKGRLSLNLLSWFFGFLSILFMLGATVGAYNIAADDSEAQTHTSVILRRGESSVSITDWKNPEETRSVDVPRSMARDAEVGIDQLKITLREGALGIPWAENIELVEGE